MHQVAEWIATGATGLFAGAALYITLVEHPARLQCGTAVALTQWAPSYKRATVMQVLLGLAGSVSSFASWFAGGGTSWLIAGALLFSVIPFTVVVILPTNQRLQEPTRDKASPETLALLTRWGNLHLVRVILSLAAFFIMAGARRGV